MAINAYTGVMGSGKSFEVVCSVILPAICQGRRVVTNIDGLSEERLLDYCLQRDQALSVEQLGSIVHCQDEVIRQSHFFPDETKPEQHSVVQPGDLVVIDEAWRHWNRDKQVTPEAMQFFRMHRHYTHPVTGVSCDVALIFQSITDVHRSVRSVIEMTARTVKIKTLGLARTYRIEFYEGDRLTKAARFSRKVNHYDKAIFPLYKSYAGTQGKELVMDKRQNVLSNPWVWVSALGIVVLFIVSLSYLRHWFNKPRQGIASRRSALSAKQPGLPVKAAPLASQPSLPPLSSSRIAGEVVIHGARWVVIMDEQGRSHLESPAPFAGRGVMLVGHLEGQRVTTWSGGSPSQAIVGGAP